jgi:hypothetical protein
VLEPPFEKSGDRLALDWNLAFACILHQPGRLSLRRSTAAMDRCAHRPVALGLRITADTDLDLPNAW